MSAAAARELLAEATALGARLVIEGDAIALDMPWDFPDSLVDRLRVAKPELLAELHQHEAQDWRERNTAARPEQFVNSGNMGTAAGQERASLDPVTMRDDYEERAASVEFDGRRPRTEAEAEAHRAAIARWMYHHPPATAGAPDRCAHCEQGPKPCHVIVPFGVPEYGTAWLHHGCWQDWYAQRRAKAQAGLAALGIAKP